MEAQALDPQNQSHWPDIVDLCAYSHKHISELADVNIQTFKSWIKDKSPRKPRKLEEVIILMTELNKTKGIQKHPSFGYATPYEIKRLQEIGLGAEHNQIMKTIADRTKKKGKVK